MRFEDSVRDLFDEVVSLPADQRQQVIGAQGRDPAVVEEVRRLLELDAETSSFLGGSAAERFGRLGVTVGSRLAEFEILKLIGRGGMGVVFLASDTTLNRRVALKILPELSISEHALARFRQGARAAAQLTHPGIVAVYRFDESHGVPFIVMEYVAGETLAAKIQRRREEQSAASEAQPGKGGNSVGGPALDSREALRIVYQVADALDYAHRQGVLHRDVKPSNILIGNDGRAKITDFGIAKILTDQTITQPGEVLATIHYMSPEQASASARIIDHRSDVFSLGVVLYEALALRRPFEGERVEQVVRSLLFDEPVPLRRLAPRVSKDVAVVCHSALEKEPNHRMPTMAHMAAELRSCLNNEPIVTRPPSLARKWTRTIKRRRAYIATGLLMILVPSTAGLAYAAWRRHLATQAVLVLTSPDSGGSGRAEVRRWRDDTDELAEPIALGELPVRVHLPPGAYRIAVVRDGQIIAEFDDYLHMGRVVEHALPKGREEDGSSPMVAFDAERFDWIIKNPLTGQPENRARTLEPFAIETTEVSNAQYKAFIDSTGRPPPPMWLSRGYSPELADLPVTGVTHQDALAYAIWAGKRLPTHDEWMAAAQYPGSRRHPWGEESTPPSAKPSCEAILGKQDNTVDGLEIAFLRHARPVNSDPECATPAGLLHMFGNVSEITGTTRFFRPQLDSQGTLTVVVAGGDWYTDPRFTDLSMLALMPAGVRNTTIGFRCARSIRSSTAQSQGGVR